MIELLHAMNSPASRAIIAQLEQELAGLPGHDAAFPTNLGAPDQARGNKLDDPANRPLGTLLGPGSR